MMRWDGTNKDLERVLDDIVNWINNQEAGNRGNEKGSGFATKDSTSFRQPRPKSLKR